MSFTHKNKTYIFHPQIIKDLKDNGLLDKYETKDFYISVSARTTSDEYRSRDYDDHDITHNLPLDDNQIIKDVSCDSGKLCDITFHKMFNLLDWKFNYDSDKGYTVTFSEAEFTCIVLKLNQ